MQDKRHINFSNSCPSTVQLAAYARGTLSEKAANTIEKHLLNCPLCTEALELSHEQLSRPSFERTVGELTDRAWKKVSPKPQFSRPAIWWTAAAFLLIAVISSLLLFQREAKHPSSEPMAHVQEQETISADTSSKNPVAGRRKQYEIDADVSSQPPEEQGFTITKSKKEPEKYVTGAITPDQPILEFEQPLEEFNAGSPSYDAQTSISMLEDADLNLDYKFKDTLSVLSKDELSPGNEVAEREETIAMNDKLSPQDGFYREGGTVARSDSIVVRSLPNVSIQRQFSLFDGKRNKLSRAEKKLLEESAALMRSAKYAVERDDYPLAIEKYESIARQPNNPYREEALWELSSVYLSLGDKQKAKTALQMLIQMNGNYKNDAKIRLRNLSE